MDKPLDQRLADVARLLETELGQNLFSCCVYGSAVRGNAVEGVSDINLLLVLETSSTVAHESVARVVAREALLDPLIVEHRSFARTARCFANKFSSIQRNYRVLHGADPFAGVTVDSDLERLLCEQALRNLRLRATYAFVMDGRQWNYRHFLREIVSATFTQLSDVLRLSDRDVPKDFAERIAPMVTTWSIDSSILRDLLELREERKEPAKDELADWHQRLLSVVDTVLQWIERNWQPTTPPRA